MVRKILITGAIAGIYILATTCMSLASSPDSMTVTNHLNKIVMINLIEEDFNKSKLDLFDHGIIEKHRKKFVWELDDAFANHVGSFNIPNGKEIDGTDVAPVPEPATMLLFGSGLMGLAVMWRKKSVKK